MLDELRSNDWLPRSLRKTSREVEHAVHQVEQHLGRSASETEIAQHLNMPLDEYQGMLQDLHGSQLIYYEDFDRAADDEPFLDRYRVDHADPLSALLDEHLREALVEAIERLPEREKLLMSLYYERGLNLREIGAVLEVSESRVCQLHRSRACVPGCANRRGSALSPDPLLTAARADAARVPDAHRVRMLAHSARRFATILSAFRGALRRTTLRPPGSEGFTKQSCGTTASAPLPERRSRHQSRNF